MAFSILDRAKKRGHQQCRADVFKALAQLFMNLHASIVVALHQSLNLHNSPSRI